MNQTLIDKIAVISYKPVELNLTERKQIITALANEAKLTAATTNLLDCLQAYVQAEMSPNIAALIKWQATIRLGNAVTEAKDALGIR